MPQSSSSHHSTESAVKAPHRRTLGDDEVGSSTHSTIPNGDPVVSTEDVKLETGNPPVVSSSDEVEETIKYFVFSI